MMRNYLVAVLLLIVVLGCIESDRKATPGLFVVCGSVHVRTQGGLPPHSVDFVRPLSQCTCIRIYSDPLFDSTTLYQQITTDSLGRYKFETEDPTFALAIVSGTGPTVVDSIRNIPYQKLHVVEFSADADDTLFIADTILNPLSS